MRKRARFSLRDRIRSVGYGVRGLYIVLSSQHNTWIYALATALVCILGGYFGLTKIEWCLVVTAIVTVWMAEAFNTALEFLADVVSPDFHPAVGKAKDVAAGAVLVAAIGSVVIAILIFGPHIV